MDIVNIMNKASEEALSESTKEIDLKLALLEEKALSFLRLKQEADRIEETLKGFKEEFKAYGSFETDKVKVSISYGSMTDKLKSLKDIIKSGIVTKEVLIEKGLITTYNTGDKVSVTAKV